MIICSGCGKDVPFFGKVCPHCMRDKSADKERTLIVLGAGALGITAGAVAGQIAAGKPLVPAMAAGFVVMAGAFLVTGLKGSVAKRNARHGIGAPKFEVASPIPQSQPDHETRLRKLEDLKAKGLIAEDEYRAKRAAILGDL